MSHTNSITLLHHQDKVVGFKHSSLVSALFLAASAIPLASLTQAATLDNNSLNSDLSITFDDGAEHLFDGIDINIQPPSKWDYYTVTASETGTRLNIDGKTSFYSYTTGPENQDGTYALYAKKWSLHQFEW